MRPSSTLDHYHLFNIFRKNTGIPQRNATSERMGNDRKWCEALLMDQLSEIIQVTRMAIASAHYMGGITMASEVGRDDMKSVPKCDVGVALVDIVMLTAPPERLRQSFTSRAARAHAWQ